LVWSEWLQSVPTEVLILGHAGQSSDHDLVVDWRFLLAQGVVQLVPCQMLQLHQQEHVEEVAAQGQGQG